MGSNWGWLWGLYALHLEVQFPCKYVICFTLKCVLFNSKAFYFRFINSQKTEIHVGNVHRLGSIHNDLIRRTTDKLLN